MIFFGASCHRNTSTVPGHDRFLEIAVKFQKIWNFPNVIGCIDGKRIHIKCPKKDGSVFYNYK